MFHLLLVTFLLARAGAGQDLEAEESVPPVQVYGLDEVHQEHGHAQHKQAHDVYLHSIRGHKDQLNVDRIVSDFYNPDYIEPIRVLDYRYLKTGGRDYTRSAGGQILILPKNVRIHQKKEFGNYDELLEFLRLKQLAELEAHHKEMSSLGYDHKQNKYEHHIEVNGNHQYYDHKNTHHPGGYGGYGAYKRDAEEIPSTADLADVKSV